MPNEPAGTRSELRDPFAEVTYRVDSFAEMVTKADQLGATRFHSVANFHDSRASHPFMKDTEGVQLPEG